MKLFRKKSFKDSTNTGISKTVIPLRPREPTILYIHNNVFINMRIETMKKYEILLGVLVDGVRN